jgi:RsiW-degrading membrane proteinase PrsW (M82 family)
MFLTFIENYPFLVAFILGLIPALIWLFFWLKEDIHPEPAKMLTLAFLGGMLSVLFVLPIQKVVYDHLREFTFLSFALWAAIEEVSKFLFVYYIALKRKYVDEPVDDIIYLIVSALGFVTFENTLFLTEFLRDGDLMGTIINGNMRFIGASLIHVMSSAVIGIMMGLSYYKTKKNKILYTISGIFIAIVLHTSFNLFIISRAPGNIFFVFGAVWFGIVVLLLLFEKVKHLSGEEIKINL